MKVDRRFKKFPSKKIIRIPYKVFLFLKAKKKGVESLGETLIRLLKINTKE